MAFEFSKRILRTTDGVPVAIPDGEGGWEAWDGDIDLSELSTIDIISQTEEEILDRGELQKVTRSILTYRPGSTSGAEIEITAENPVAIEEGVNDKFNFEANQSEPQEVTIPTGVYESGHDLVEAINTGLGSDIITTWTGEDTGFISFISMAVGMHSYVTIMEPASDSAITDIGFDNPQLIKENYGQETLQDVIQELNEIRHSLVVRNNILIDELLQWDGAQEEKHTSNIPVPQGQEILIYSDNSTDKELTLTLQHRVDEEIYSPHQEISFVVGPMSTAVFGPIQGFPRFMGGRVVVTAPEDNAPIEHSETFIQVIES